MYLQQFLIVLPLIIGGLAVPVANQDKVVRAIVEADRSWQAAGYGDDKSSSGNVARNPIEPDHSYEAENFGDGKSIVKERAVVNSVNPKKGHTYMRSENVGLSKRAIADGVDTDRSGYDHYHYDDSGAEKRAVVEAVEPDRSYDHFHYDDVSSEKRAIVEARELEGRHGFTAKSTDKTIQRAVEDTADMDRSGYDHFHYDDSGAEKRAVVEGVDPDRSYGHFHYDDAGVSK